ncbi:MAG: polysaccharide biosynthesis tyrosine autokinase [Syntrophobacterales bacterium]|nr:MAG: polysaccharide biosynthesis tyrosine autokinase [Syntrophobacterales bacterium]
MTASSQEIHLKDYLRVILKRKWIISTFLVIVVTLAVLSSLKKEPFYRATVRLSIQKQNANVVLFPNMAFPLYDPDYYQTQYTILRSRPLAERVIKKLKLQESPEFKAPPRPKFSLDIKTPVYWLLKKVKALNPFSKSSVAKGVIKPFNSKKNGISQGLINAFIGRLGVSPMKDTKMVVDLRFTGRYPHIIAKIVNAVAEEYINMTMEAKIEVAQKMMAKLTEQLAQHKVKVEESEIALQKYKEKKNIVSLEERQNIVVQRLSQLNALVTGAKTERIAIETRYKELKKLANQPEMIESLPSILSNTMIQRFKTDYVDLQRRYSELSKKYGAKHPKMTELRSQIGLMKRKIALEVKKNVNSLMTEYKVAQSKETTLTEALENQKKEALELNRKAIEYKILERDAESNRQMYNVLITKMKEVDLSSDLKGTNIRIIDPAQVPRSPIGPKRGFNILFAAFLGVGLGVALAFFLEYIDTSMKTPEDIKRIQIPYIGFIPTFHPNNHLELIVQEDPKSLISEAYRTLRTGILFSGSKASPQFIQVTSAGPQEGKTITAANLATVMAQSGSRVLIVDCDMRKPRIHEIFGLPNARGLSNLLLDGEDGFSLIKETKVPNLSILTCGTVPANPSELLSSKRMQRLLTLFAEKYDRIIMDSPPVLAVTDSIVLSRLVEGIILVVGAGTSSRNGVARSVELLKEVNAQIVGAVLNNLNVEKERYYYSRYYYYDYGKYGYHAYGDNGNRKKKKKKRVIRPYYSKRLKGKSINPSKRENLRKVS